MSSNKIVRIGGASGFWGDSSMAVPQLLNAQPIDYLVFDYLAEVTMSIMAAARLKNPELGYATDFVTVVRENFPQIMGAGVRLIANAGGVNPRSCVKALEAAAALAGVSVRIACVEGDDVMALLPQLRTEGVGEIQDGRPLPEKLLTANAYLGALPIKAALDAGAQIIVTGRCVDSAVTLGVLMYEFGWGSDEYDKLAQGSIAGHVIECGCQATGGLHTDWRSVLGWESMGYPIVECHADGRFVLTKPPETGGLVSTAAVAEQILYEVGDPKRYLLPDVTCDFSGVHLVQEGPERVSVSGVRGLQPTRSYKVSSTYLAGYKVSMQLTIIGDEAVDKARRTADALFARTRVMLSEKGLGDYSDTLVEILGSEDGYGTHGHGMRAREVVLRIAARHPDRRALELLARELAPSGTSFAPGTTGVGGRAQPTPAIQQYAFLLDKSRLSAQVCMDGKVIVVPIPAGGDVPEAVRDEAPVCQLLAGDDPVDVPLIRIAYARSGDKGDISNIGVIARSKELLPHLVREVTETSVKRHLAHLVKGPVHRFFVPGLHALNFLCEQALGGGGMASLRNDPYGKSMAQILLSMNVRIPRRLVEPSIVR